MPMTKKEALEKLAGWDHCAVSPQAAQEVADAFGVDPKWIPAYSARDNRNEFKGLTLKAGPNAIERVVDADSLASSLCDALNLEYQSKFGRGSQLRECIRALSAVAVE